MAGRYSYSNSPYQMDDLAAYQYQYRQQMIAMQSGPRRFISAVGRFFYRLIVLTLIVGAVGGILFALYRNDVLLTVARGAGVEAQYKSLEKAIGAPGWGTPRSIDLPAESAVAAAAVPATADDGSSKQGDTVHAIAASEPKAKTADGLPIVSFDSLPTAPAKGASQAASLSEPPAATPAKASRPEPVKVARAEPAPVRQRQQPKREKAAPAKPVELTRSIPLPKAKPEPEPEPVAKAEPKPEPPAPKPAPEEDRTKPRSGDNPLKAAIRASMAAKGKAD